MSNTQSRGIRILPVPMRIENGENDKVDASRAFARAQLVSRNLTREETTKYWLAVEIPYRAFYAFEETLAVFGDPPGSHGSLLAAFERLASVISEGQVSEYQPIEDDLRGHAGYATASTSRSG